MMSAIVLTEPAMLRSRFAPIFVVVAAFLGLAAASQAADIPNTSSTAKAPDKLAAARAAIAAKNWPQAIDELKAANDTGSADWNNLMGFALRKAGSPDLAASERYYNEALRLNPQHRGALEYSGELYLMQGDLARAEGRLAQLDKACFLPCEEYRELKLAVERFKADKPQASVKP